MKLKMFVLCALFVLGATDLLTVRRPAMAALETGKAVFPAAVHYRIDPANSKFMVEARRGGLLWFKGHSHHIAVRDFGGEATVSSDLTSPASLEMKIKAASLEETGADFTARQKEIINKELEEIVLETDKYPEITFKSTDVKGKLKDGFLEVKIGGQMTLHGVTRRVVIPARVTLEGDTMRARGEFKLNRKKFNVNATNAFHGFVRIKHTLKFTFDIVGRRVS
ncbi:MAG: YceI family protein [Pyrinomonadaceae bacterium]